MRAGSLSSSRPDIFAGVAELAQAFRERRASPVEAFAACLQRIERLNPDINAFITVDHGAARQTAETAAAEIARGEHRGPLHGSSGGGQRLLRHGGNPNDGRLRTFQESGSGPPTRRQLRG